MTSNEPTNPAGGDGDDGNALVTITVLNAQPASGKALYALVDVELLIEGVEVVIYGVQARRVPDGGTSIHLPTFKAADGTWQPAIKLPSELRGPLGDIVLEFLVQEGLAKPR
ncbi:MAG: hypothetical protein QHC67_14490 [Sphingobium sp.]|uniref:hypothetical protein n=1 Tax=Sphingobium sp. TaxID=1912891 RepID=UPI0029A498CF|nr:hypothetical protein [Sphingobium sp.]MDX3911009.1 hypothetical protein [Sphingobium sp.]